MDENLSTQSAAEEQRKDVILAVDKKSKTVAAVKGIDENGELETVPPKAEFNNDFLRIDSHADGVDNFLSNFLRQLKDPTRFDFFKVDENELEKVASAIQENLKNPTPQGDELMDKHRIDPQQLEKEKQHEQTYIDPAKIDWGSIEKNTGITKEKLGKDYEKMLKGDPSDGIYFVKSVHDGVDLSGDARLSFRKQEDGSVTLKSHGILAEPRLDFPYFGHNFTPEDKENLLKTGNMGRDVPLKNYKTGELTPSFISVDKVTKELVNMPVSWLRIPDEKNGVKLDDKMKSDLAAGKGVYSDQWISKKGERFAATLQVNAQKRGLEFIFPERKQRKQEQQREDSNRKDRIPTKVAGVALKEDQQKELAKRDANHLVHVTDMTDGKGVKFDSYIIMNPDKPGVKFLGNNPDKAKAKAQAIYPTNDHKVQVAVNSEGKTNEATKHSNEPMKPKQTKPTEPQKRKQDEKKEQKSEQKQDNGKPAKSKGRKM